MPLRECPSGEQEAGRGAVATSASHYEINRMRRSMIGHPRYLARYE
jgi:hypothetical protein